MSKLFMIIGRDATGKVYHRLGGGSSTAPSARVYDSRKKAESTHAGYPGWTRPEGWHTEIIEVDTDADSKARQIERVHQSFTESALGF